MTQLPSYTTQFNVITEAYIKGEIKPYSNEFCFCGTLSPDWRWRDQKNGKDYLYSVNEFEAMEEALFDCITQCDFGCNFLEDELFNGMCAALEVLKDIHREHGEVIDDAPVFKKRVDTTHCA